MKTLTIKLLLFFNYIGVILVMGEAILLRSPIPVRLLVPLCLATLLLGDIAYIAACCLRGNQILFLFCGLLAADSWYLVFVADPSDAGKQWLLLLGPLILYLSIRFCFLFLFQGYAYKGKQAIRFLLAAFCIAAIISAFLEERIYACAYGIQLVGSFLCFLLVILCHRKRVGFVLRSEKKPLLLSLTVTLAVFFAYCRITAGTEDPLGNFGVYLAVLIFFMSVHGIVLKETDGSPLSAIFHSWQRLLLFFVLTGLLLLLCAAFGWQFPVFLLLVNLSAAFLFLCCILLGENLKAEQPALIKDSDYACALNRIKHEEELKETFSNFLHDEVLQDLLSVKNLAGKSDRPEIRQLILKTLDQLNLRIREKMQDCHPVLLKNLTFKENLEQLILSIQSLFPQQKIRVTFLCSDTLLMPAPYDVLIYRLVRELLTNIYKHSGGTHAWIALSLEGTTAKLSVWDDGAQISVPEADGTVSFWHKGLFSMKEQIDSLGGTMTVSSRIPQGVRTEIQFDVKGEDSYQHFIRG